MFLPLGQQEREIGIVSITTNVIGFSALTLQSPGATFEIPPLACPIGISGALFYVDNKLAAAPVGLLGLLLTIQVSTTGAAPSLSVRRCIGSATCRSSMLPQPQVCSWCSFGSPMLAHPATVSARCDANFSSQEGFLCTPHSTFLQGGCSITASAPESLISPTSIFCGV